MREILVSEVMTRDPFTVKPDTNLLECARKMVRKRVGSILITEKKKLFGFISQRDILWAIVKKSRKDLTDIKAMDISPKKLGTVKPDVTVREVIKRMNKLKFDRLPVVHEGNLVGIVTAKDVLNFHPEFYPEIQEYAKIREEADKLRRIKKLKDDNFISEGICEECGSQDILHSIDGMSICESCESSR